MKSMRNENEPRIVLGWTSAFVVLLGLTVLAGWAWDIAALKSLLPGLVAMKANTALNFALAGAGLCLLTAPRLGETGRWAGRVAAGLVGSLALATLSQDFFGWDLGIDQLLFPEPAGTSFTVHPGRMSPLTAVNFALFTAALLLLDSRRAASVVQGLALLLGAVALLPLVGYLFGARVVFAPGRFTPMAAHTALGFLILAAGLLAATAERGLLARMRTRLPALGFGFAVALLVVSAFASFLNTRLMIETSSWVEHTQQVLNRLAAAENELTKTVAAARGFVATGNEVFLAPLPAGRGELTDVLSELEQWLADNPAQRQRLHSLRSIIARRLAFSAESVRLRREQGAAAAMAQMATGEGERLVAEVRAQVAEMERVEEELLARRRADAAASNASTVLAMAFAGAVSLALLVGLYAAVRRLNRGLEARVRERTAELQRANRALRTLSDCNQALVRAESEPELHNQVCRILVEHGGYRMAFVGMAEHDAAKSIRIAAWVGTEPPGSLTWAENDERGHGPAAVAIRTGQPAVANDAHGYPGFLAWRDTLRRLGVNSAAALPLVVESATIGALAMTAAETDAFDAAEMVLLTELANDLAFGVATIRARAARERAEAQRAESEERLRQVWEHARVPMRLADAAGCVVLVNDAYCRLVGRPRAELVGQPVAAAYDAAQQDQIQRDFLARYQQGGSVWEREADVTFWDGRHATVEATESFFELPGKGALLLTTLRDLTERKRTAVALQESETRFRQLFTEMTSGFALHEIICDAAGRPVDYRFLEVNRAFETLTGLSRERLIGHTVLEVLPGTEPHWIENFGRVALTGERVQFENYSRDLGKHFEVVAYQPAPGRFAVVCSDVTQRKRAAEALRESEFLYHSLVENVRQHIFRKDTAGRFTFGNGPFCQGMGRPLAELLGKTDADFFPPEVAAKYRQDDARVLRTGEPFEGQETFQQADGQTLHVQVLKTPLRDAARQIVGLQGVAWDITERKRAEETLRESEARFASAFEFAAIGKALVAPEGRWLKVNRALCELTGYPADELLTKTFQDLTHPDDLQADLEFVRQMLAGERQTYQMEKRYFHKQGQVVWVLLSVSLVRDGQGQPLYFIAQIQDITERKQGQERIREQLAELERSYNALLGREARVQVLKREVNQLLKRQGEPARYPSEEI
ncbi:MAG: PAS domain S-box protein [Verrucomicrobia bacterium]|nr:PAS domain S-box protein [Verrucomicrobiota bacterium]